MCKKYPDKKVMFGIMASDYPRLKVTPKQAVMTGQALASMYVDNNGREELAFTLELVRQNDTNTHSINNFMRSQWNLSNRDTNGAEESVVVSEVSSFQLEWLYLGWESVLFRGVLCSEVSL